MVSLLAAFRVIYARHLSSSRYPGSFPNWGVRGLSYGIYCYLTPTARFTIVPESWHLPWFRSTLWDSCILPCWTLLEQRLLQLLFLRATCHMCIIVNIWQAHIGWWSSPGIGAGRTSDARLLGLWVASRLILFRSRLAQILGWKHPAGFLVSLNGGFGSNNMGVPAGDILSNKARQRNPLEERHSSGISWCHAFTT